MQNCEKQSLPGRPLWVRAVVLLFVLLLLLAFAMAASPELHREIHSDAGSAGHECLATSIQAGTIDLLVAVLVAIVLIFACFANIPSLPCFVASNVFYRLLPGRAPPGF